MRGLKEACARLFNFIRYPPAKSELIPKSDAIRGLHEDFNRCIKEQCIWLEFGLRLHDFGALLANGSDRAVRARWLASTSVSSTNPSDFSHLGQSG